MLKFDSIDSSDTYKVYSQAAREILSLDEDTIRNLDIKSIPNFANHPFCRFFQHLANAVSTKPPAIPHTNRAQSTGAISSSGDEDKDEEIARLCVQELCNAILLKGNMGVLLNGRSRCPFPKVFRVV
ncbi:hypothetical protein AWENTII_002357 [Aspergillus wentii]